jgi:hypothetical protein
VSFINKETNVVNRIVESPPMISSDDVTTVEEQSSTTASASTSAPTASENAAFESKRQPITVEDETDDKERELQCSIKKARQMVGDYCLICLSTETKRDALHSMSCCKKMMHPRRLIHLEHSCEKTGQALKCPHCRRKILVLPLFLRTLPVQLNVMLLINTYILLSS